MEVVFLLIPISIIIIFLTIWAFVWSVENDQFENLDKEAERILSEEDR
ncbi:MAG: cbb3-type cytochrome oxidase assembly protein CcoS [Gammaproteobacteria bacterium]|jgi:cbb3-type cytochrome oxidase maturation protein|nr:cbb3-type cytochrome oxidase assembly protein CcoS [Gammaproteobacteria bacterium]MDP6181374.1 cbb3-type cytochrome oxidase assembly protein CcoS [SAR86 cluster bacterium]|tara:strand:+ start:7117 stop:7260 length:144 start_codon:yes stop_codon:yes gene_type:complete